MTGRGNYRRLASTIAAVGLLVGLSGCAGQAPRHPSASIPPALSYWTRQRLDLAVPWVVRRQSPHTARTAVPGPRVGAVFDTDVGGGHFCTAGVVASPHDDLLVTAAHCVHGGRGAGYRQDLVFVPAFADGQTPYGVWPITAAVVDQRWIDSSDPDADVAFLVVAPRDGRNVAQVLGANALTFDGGYNLRVRVTGYPDDQSQPITCSNRTTALSAHQLEFVCGGYSTGTSGSPWLTAFDPRTRTGHIVGVIGGYQQGGDTDDVSYSPYFDSAIKALYARAVARG